MVALALPGFLRAAPVLRAIVAALLARSAIHAAGKLKKFSAPALAVRRDEVHELMELLPPPDAKALGGEALTAQDYARFLSVCRWKVPKAAALLRADLEWRRGARPRAYQRKKSSKQLDRKAAPLVLARGKLTSADGVNGWRVIERRTKQLGMPVMLVTTREFRPKEASALPWVRIEENKKHIHYMVEECIRRLPDKAPGVVGSVILLDMTKFKVSNLIPYVKDGIMLCQKSYPCRLGAVVAYNLPAYFPLVWRIASPWFNEDIKSKIVFPPRHLHDADSVMDWLDEKERKKEKPFALTYRQLEEFGDLA